MDEIDLLKKEITELRDHFNRVENDGRRDDGIRLLHYAKIEALIALCQRIAIETGIKRLDGLSVQEWFWHRFWKELDDTLREIENEDPKKAAILQSIIDQSMRAVKGEDSTEET